MFVLASVFAREYKRYVLQFRSVNIRVTDIRTREVCVMEMLLFEMREC